MPRQRPTVLATLLARNLGHPTFSPRFAPRENNPVGAVRRKPDDTDICRVATNARCASRPRVKCSDDKKRSIPTAPRGVNAHGGLFTSVFLERAPGLRRRRVHVRRSHGHVLDRALQQLGHRSIPHPKILGRIRLQSQDLRVPAKDIQRRSTSVVGLVAGSTSEGLGHAAGQLQCSITKCTVAWEIGPPDGRSPLRGPRTHSAIVV
jgi:hypothetical protein